MQDKQEEIPSSRLTSETHGENRLAEGAIRVMCPVCWAESVIPEGASPKHVPVEQAGREISGSPPHRCRCGSRLDPQAHRAEIMRERLRLTRHPVTARRAREFLLTLANMSRDWLVMCTAEGIEHVFEGAKRLVKKFPEFFPSPFPEDSYALRTINRRWQQWPHPVEPEGMLAPTFMDSPSSKWMSPSMYSLHSLVLIHGNMQLLWKTHERKRRDWLVHNLRRDAWEITVHPSVGLDDFGGMFLHDQSPPEDAFQQALLYLQTRAHMARCCANTECKQLPFFFADKPNQKYCSDICSQAVRAEAKRQWWADKGAQWRASRNKRPMVQKKRRSKSDAKR
jgi:hypothetical protein